MDSLKPPSVFHVFLWLPVALALVEEPTNVTLQCHNMHNIVRWSYPRLLPGLRFRVDILSYSGPADAVWVDPPALQANVSSLSDPDNEYFLTVTAVIGQNESVSAPPDGITFSYFMDSPTTQKCYLDLPPVNITARPDDIIAFSFTHPWLFYHPAMPSSQISRPRNKRRHYAQRELPLFNYGVVIISQQPHHFRCAKSVCKQEIPVERAREEHCLNITGEMQKIAVKSTQLYCTGPFSETSEKQHEQKNYVIYIVVSLLSVSVVAFILFLVYKKMTSPRSANATSITIHRTRPNTTAAVEEITVVRVEPSSPTPLLSHHYHDSGFTLADGGSTEPDVLRLPIGVSTNGGMREHVETERADDEGEGYRAGGNLDEAETESCSEAPSGYEKREVLVELGPNDSVEGYRA
ncbi:interferon gamma receptor 1-like isoform X2 [Solea solea]|uniref:interferon gamma receptor 1-like isoform X2 n=1 Tax=Solea solea TaxID=90069 RepID=UPI002729D798|nr:interferon gamma receptor 1-like isoform X2 [Solea solea]